MTLLTPDLRIALRVNSIARCAAKEHGKAAPDVPVLKLFNPVASQTWLATELVSDGDALHGLADWGFGCPEPCGFSLSALEHLRLPFGLRIERDTGFFGRFPLSVYAEAARRTGNLMTAEALLHRCPPGSTPGFPDPPAGADPGGG